MSNSDSIVVIAMSGGVDSSVAAALLLQAGYQVIGITMKLWEYQDVGGNVNNSSTCCTVDSMNDARAVCQTLGIPHYVVDFQTVSLNPQKLMEDYLKTVAITL